MNAATRKSLIERYVNGPELLRAAVAKAPAAALRWRPAPGKWSVHEVVGHCADSETVSSTRIRFLVGEERPTIHGYDQDRWAERFDYHSMPLELGLAQVAQVRAWTAELVRRLPESAWDCSGTHTESGHYTAARWLELYAEHLEAHSRQIDRNVAAWNSRTA